MASFCFALAAAMTFTSILLPVKNSLYPAIKIDNALAKHIKKYLGIKE